VTKRRKKSREKFHGGSSGRGEMSNRTTQIRAFRIIVKGMLTIGATASIVLFGALLAQAQTGIYHSTGTHNGDSCTSDSTYSDAGGWCAGDPAHTHYIFIIKENRSFDQYLGRLPGVPGYPVMSLICMDGHGSCSNGLGVPSAANPAGADPDPNHNHADFVNEYNSGLMNGFNRTSPTGWALSYGPVCSDYHTSSQVCHDNNDCTCPEGGCKPSPTCGGNTLSTCTVTSCPNNTLSTYFLYALNYGVGAEFFANVTSGSFPTHLYSVAMSTNEIIDNPSTTLGPTGSSSPNGEFSQKWTCDAYHYGQCSNSPTTLCSKNSDCSSGDTCKINLGTGTGYYNKATSCTNNTDEALTFSLSSGASPYGIAGNGTTATATCVPNCGSLVAGVYVTISGNSESAFNGSFKVATVIGSPVTGFTFASSTNASGKGGTISYDYCVNGNVYVGKALTAPDIDILGGTGNAFAPGVCVANSLQTCTCAIKFDGDTTATTPCPDTSGFCGGSGNNCNLTQAIGGTRGAQCPNITTIADKLDAASVPWHVYNEYSGQHWNWASYIAHIRYGADWTNDVTVKDGEFISTATNCVSDSNCSLANAVWLNTGDAYSEHPPSTVNAGMQWTANQVNACMTNLYCWKHSVIFIMWDEWGGFYDHVAPPQDSLGYTTGFRVPFLCVSAYCTPGINNTTLSFSSLLRCLEIQYNLTPINSSDGTANDVCTSPGGMVNFALYNPPLPAAASANEPGQKSEAAAKAPVH
jgi:hypothetical protein